MLARQVWKFTEFYCLESHSSLCDVVPLAEWNSQTFEGCERNVLDLKLQLFHTLFEWLVIGMYYFTNMLEFLDLCSF
jgi:hypothetical protein